MSGTLGRVIGGPALAAIIVGIPCCGSDAEGDGQAVMGGRGGAAMGEAGRIAGATSGGGGNAGTNAGKGGSAGDAAGGAAGTDGSAGAPGDAGGSAGHGGSPIEPSCEPETVGNWALGDNLYVTVDEGCFVSNFCSIDEGIHTQGTLSDGMLHLDEVGGSPLSFAYTVSTDTFTIVDGFQGNDLPLGRMDGPLPVSCPPP